MRERREGGFNWVQNCVRLIAFESTGRVELWRFFVWERVREVSGRLAYGFRS